MTAEPPSPAVRVCRLLRAGRNPLARGTDRAEAAVMIVFLLLALLLLPVALTVASVTYTSVAELSASQNRTRHETVAVLIRDSSDPSVGASDAISTGYSTVPARWELADGTTRTGAIRAEEGLKAGAKVPVWLDESGDPAHPPLSTMDATAAGVSVAVFGWLTVAGLLALAAWGLHRVFDRSRCRAWAAEWARVERNWHGRRR